MDDSHAEVLAHILPRSPATILHLDSNFFTEKGAIVLTHAVSLSQVQNFDLQGNKIKIISRLLVHALSGSQVRILNLNRNEIVDISALASLPSQMLDIHLSYNAITDISGLIHQVLPQSQIGKLWLRENQIKNVSGLVQALFQSHNIVKLDLCDNQIEDHDKANLRGLIKNKNGDEIEIVVDIGC